MSKYVNCYSKLKCNKGTLQSVLTILPNSTSLASGAIATIMDHKSMVNIMSFGMCNSQLNPAVAAATAAAMGTPTPAPCIPNTLAPWLKGKTNFTVCNKPVLMDDAILYCSYAGKIEIASVGKTAEDKAEGTGTPKCPLCGKDWDDKHEKNKSKECLNGKSCGCTKRCTNGFDGNGQKLATRLNIKKGEPMKKHPMYNGKSSLAAHHLICSEAIRTDEEAWREIVHLTGYSINCYKNGVFLPMKLKQACHFDVPVHVGGHAAGYGGCAAKSYPNAVMNEINAIVTYYRDLKACEDKEKLKDFVNDMNEASERIFGYVKNFVWTITWDGFDYEPKNPIGCANETTIPGKQDKLKNKLETLRQERIDKQDKINTTIETAIGKGMSSVEAIERTRDRQEKMVEKLSEQYDKDEHSEAITCQHERVHIMKAGKPKAKKYELKLLDKS